MVVAFKVADINFTKTNDPRTFAFILNRLGSDIPIRWCAMHKFLENGAVGVSRLTMLVDSAIVAFSPEIRARLRLHYGTSVRVSFLSPPPMEFLIDLAFLAVL